MEIVITKGKQEQLPAIEALYLAVHADLAANKNYPGWQRDVYPTPETADVALAAETMYMAWIGADLVGSVILNHEQPEAFRSIPWPIALGETRVVVVHTLAVHPNFRRYGVAHSLLQFAEQLAQQCQVQALRLDTYTENTPAIQLYERIGFVWRGNVDLGFGCYDLPLFAVYEKIID